MWTGYYPSPKRNNDDGFSGVPTMGSKYDVNLLVIQEVHPYILGMAKNGGTESTVVVPSDGATPLAAAWTTALTVSKPVCPPLT
jgi:hypothetical protein